MPRRYRPPTRRRKLKKTPYGELEAPSYQGVAPASRPAPLAAESFPQAEEEQPASHIARDHTYVLGDLRRIAVLVAFILGGLIITAILR